MFAGKYISGEFDFSFCNTDLPFVFTNSVFEKEIKFFNSKIKILNLTGTLVKSINAQVLICDNHIFLKNGFQSNGKVNFGSAKIYGSLSCKKGKFINENGDALNCDKVKIGGSVFLSDGFEANGKVNFNSAQINGSLTCLNGKFNNQKGDALNCVKVKIGGSVLLKNSFESKGRVIFSSAQIGSEIDCSDGKFNNKNGDALNCNGAKIEGVAVLTDNFEANGTVSFISAQIGLGLNCRNGKFINEKKIALNCNGAKIEGVVSLIDNFEANGTVSFASAQIGLSLNCRNGKFINEKGIALNCDKVKIQNSVFLDNGFESKGIVSFASAQIGSSLSCRNGKFINEKGIALNCDKVKIQNSVFFDNSFESEGKVNFDSAQIGSDLRCTNGKFINENGDALVCDKSKIVGSVFLNKVVINGNVNFNLVKIGASLNCIGSSFENVKGDSLNFNGSNIKGNVLLKNGFLAKGEVDFSSAQIGNNFDCSQGRFISNEENKNVLNCERIKILGDVNLDKNFYANGEVNFYSARINGNLNCDSGNFINKNENAYSLYCQNIEVLGDVFLRKRIYVKGDIDFYSAKIGRTFILNDGWIKGDLILLSAKIDELDIDIKNWKIDNFVLDGLQYNHFKVEDIVSESLINWLEKKPEEENFKPQPYKQLVKVLRNMGHHKESNDIMIKYNDITTSKSENWFIKKLKQVYGITAGYGYKPMRVLGTMFTIWFFCSLFYLYASKVAIFAPSDTLVFQNLKYKSSINKCGVPLKNFNWSEIYYHNSNDDDNKCIESKMNNIEQNQKSNKTQNWTTNENLEGEYTTFSPYWYSLDILLPIVDLQMDEDWGVFISSINSDITLNHVTRWIVWIEILLGWIYSLILVAILSGLAKNEKD